MVNNESPNRNGRGLFLYMLFVRLLFVIMPHFRIKIC